MYTPFVYVDVVTVIDFTCPKWLALWCVILGLWIFEVLKWSWISETYCVEKKLISHKMAYAVKKCIPGKQFPIIIKLKLEWEPTS